MPRKKTAPKQMGRPKKKFDIDEFEKLCALQCTELEISAWFDMCEDTLNSRCKEYYEGKTFSDIFAEKRKIGHVSLRRRQWNMADNNPTMAIFLGKQYLGQKDEKHIDHTSDGKPIEHNPITDKHKAKIADMLDELDKRS